MEIHCPEIKRVLLLRMKAMEETVRNTGVLPVYNI